MCLWLKSFDGGPRVCIINHGESGSTLGPFQNRLSDGMVRSSPRVKMVEGWSGSSFSVIML